MTDLHFLFCIFYLKAYSSWHIHKSHNQKKETLIIIYLKEIPFWNAYHFFKIISMLNHRTSLVAQMVKNLPAMWETWVQSLGLEDPLEKETATHSSFLPGEFQGQRSLVGYSPWGSQELDTTGWLTLSLKS